MAYLAMAGLKARDAIDVLPVVLDLATAAQMNLGLTADIVTDIGLAFGYTGRETKKVADVLAQAVMNSNTTVEKMGTSFKYLASFAVASGQSIEDMATALALLAQVGIKAHTGGTGMRESLINMVTPAKRRKIQDILGVNVANERGEFRALFDILEDLRKSLSRFSQVKQLELMSQIFGKRGGNVMLALVNRDLDEVEQMRRTIYRYDGAVEKMAGTMRDSLWGSWKEFVSILQDVQVEIGTALVPAVRGVLDYLTRAIRSVGDFLAENHKLVVGVSLAVPALIAAGGAALVFGKALTMIAAIAAPVFSVVSAGIGAMTVSVVGATAALSVLSTTLVLVASAVQTMAAVAQSTVGIVSMLSIATGGLVVGMVALAKLPAMIVGGFKSLVGVLARVVSMSSAASSEMAKTATVAVGATARTAIGAVAGVLTAVANVIPFLLSFAAAGAMIWTAWHVIPIVFWSVVEAVKATVVAVLDASRSIASALGQTLLGTLKSVGNAFVNIGGAAYNYFQRHKDALTGLLASLQRAFGQMRETYDYVVKALMSGDVELAMELITLEAFDQLEKLEVFARKLLRKILDDVPVMMGKFADFLETMFGDIGQVFMDLWTTIRQEFRILESEIFHSLSKYFQVLFNRMPPEPDLVRKQVQEERARTALERHAPEQLEQFEAGQRKYIRLRFGVDTPAIRAKRQEVQDYERELAGRRDFRLGDTVKMERLKSELKVLQEAELQRLLRANDDADVKFYLDAMGGDLPRAKHDNAIVGAIKDAKQAIGDKLGDIADSDAWMANPGREAEKDELRRRIDQSAFEFERIRNEGRNPELAKAEKEKAEMEKQMEQYQRFGIGGEPLKELIARLEELNRTMKGMKGMTEFGQPSPRNAQYYAGEWQGFLEWEKTLPEEVKQQPWFQETKGRREELLALAKKREEAGGQFSEEADRRRFDELRIEDYVARGLHFERAEAVVETENRNDRAMFLRREQERLREAQVEQEASLLQMRKESADRRRVHEERVRETRVEAKALDRAAKERLEQFAADHPEIATEVGLFASAISAQLSGDEAASIAARDAWMPHRDRLQQDAPGKLDALYEAIGDGGLASSIDETSERLRTRLMSQQMFASSRPLEMKRIEQAEHQLLETRRQSAGVSRELSRYHKSEMRRQTGGFDVDVLERMASSVWGMGTFSSFDIVRGGGSSNPMLRELRSQTELLESINESINTVGD